MAADPAVERREGALAANRIRELAEKPLVGSFDADHLKAIHAYIFQDLPHHRPGEMRGDTPGWSKIRALEGQVGVHEVHYAHDNIPGRAQTVMRELGGPAALSGLAPDAFASRMAKLYGDLDFTHPFHEGNSRTLRELTRLLAQVAGYDINWTSTNVDAAERNRLYVARDIAVLERAFPGLTPQRGMETNDRAEYEASLALPGLHRTPGTSLEAIIREGLTAGPGVHQAATVAAPASPSAPVARSMGIAEMALAALASQQDAHPSPAASVAHTPIADRAHYARPAEPDGPSSPPAAKPAPVPDAAPAYRRSSPGPSP